MNTLQRRVMIGALERYIKIQSAQAKLDEHKEKDAKKAEKIRKGYDTVIDCARDMLRDLREENG